MKKKFLLVTLFLLLLLHAEVPAAVAAVEEEPRRRQFHLHLILIPVLLLLPMHLMFLLTKVTRIKQAQSKAAVLTEPELLSVLLIQALTLQMQNSRTA